MHFSKQGLVAAIPASRAAILVRRGDTIILTRDQTPGIPAQIDEQTGQVIAPARVPCSLPYVFVMVEVGERVMFERWTFFWRDSTKRRGRITCADNPSAR